MPDYVHLLRCVGRAVVKNAGKALANLVPFGEVVYDIAKDTYEEYARDRNQAQLRADIERLAQASHVEVLEAAEEIAASQPAEVCQVLTAYLSEMPSSIRQTLRRPSDPSGTTVPASLSLRKPEDLLPFLPAGLPRFKPGDRPLPADWELIEMLGKGGFGEVWKARHLHQSRKRPVAFKFCLDPVAAVTLRNEAALHDHLDRVREEASAPGIVPLLETYLAADPPCLMYEFIEGGDLAGFTREMHQQGLMIPDLATQLVHRIASIVAVAHRLAPPIVHRDLKLSNILLRPRDDDVPDLFVTDFGIGGLAAGQSLREQAGRWTVSGQPLPTVIRGAYTPLYASPQQKKGLPPEPRDDVFSLGVIWYQLLTGDLASEAPRGMRWKDKLIDDGMEPALVELLSSCFEESAEDRPEDAGILAEMLAQIASENNGVWNIDEVPKLPLEIEVTVPGQWSARRAGEPQGEWQEREQTPGMIVVRPGEVYKLDVESNAINADLCGLAHLSSLAALQELSLQQCLEVTDAGLAHLPSLTALVKLDLAGCLQVTDAGLAYLQSLTALQDLSLFMCILVTDAGLAHLQSLTALQKLNLRCCPKITDTGLAYLQNFTALQELDLWGCINITDAGVADLQHFLPDCKIVTHL